MADGDDESYDVPDLSELFRGMRDRPKRTEWDVRMWLWVAIHGRCGACGKFVTAKGMIPMKSPERVGAVCSQACVVRYQGKEREAA